MIGILLITCVISSVISAPVEVNQLYNIVVNDSRTENLRKYPFVAECKEIGTFSKSICFAMFDVTLSFYSQKLDFNTVNATYEEGNFCQALTQVLPDKPANNDSSKAFEHLARWFKDALTGKDGEDYCKQNCFFKDPYSYTKELLPVCQFILNQYSVLWNQSSPPSNPDSAEVVKLVGDTEAKAIDVKSSEPEHVAVPLVIVPASAEEVKKNVTLEVTGSSNSSSSSSAKETVKLSNETVTKQESPSAQEEKTQIVNVTEALSKPVAQTTATAAKKPETTKTEVKPEEPSKSDDPINLDNNLDDKDSQNLFDADGEQLESVDKDTDTKVDNPYPDDEDEYSEDLMARNNNKAGDKVPQEPQVFPTREEEVPRKKIEVVDFQEDPDSNFFAYLCGLMFLCVLLYILHQNRHKILACFLEGRRGNRRGRERSRGGSKAAYSKLDCNLEEAITSKKSLSGKSMDIIY